MSHETRRLLRVAWNFEVQVMSDSLRILKFWILQRQIYRQRALQFRRLSRLSEGTKRLRSALLETEVPSSPAYSSNSRPKNRRFIQGERESSAPRREHGRITRNGNRTRHINKCLRWILFARAKNKRSSSRSIHRPRDLHLCQRSSWK